MTLRELYNAIGDSTLAQDDEVVVVETALGVTLEVVVPVPPVVRTTAPVPTPAPTPPKKPQLEKDLSEDVDG